MSNKINNYLKLEKEIERKIQSIIENNRFLDHDLQNYQKINVKETELSTLKTQHDSLQRYFQSGVENVLKLLKDENSNFEEIYKKYIQCFIDFKKNSINVDSLIELRNELAEFY